MSLQFLSVSAELCVFPSSVNCNPHEANVKSFSVRFLMLSIVMPASINDSEQLKVDDESGCPLMINDLSFLKVTFRSKFRYIFSMSRSTSTSSVKLAVTASSESLSLQSFLIHKAHNAELLCQIHYGMQPHLCHEAEKL